MSRASSCLTPFGVVAAVALFPGCQHPTPYQARTPGDPAGYESRQESSTVFHVKYIGAPGAKLQEVRDLALLRAAELARAAGSHEFVLLEEHNRKQTSFIRQANPPPSAFAGPTAGERSDTERELAARSRPLITGSMHARAETQTVELRISTQPVTTHRAMDASAPYDVDALIRDLSAKYGVSAGVRN